MRPFSERLREAAAHAGLPYSQTAIARSLGISKQTVDEWMRKGRTPSQEAMAQMAEAWKVSSSWLMFEEGPMVPEPSGAADLSKDERYLLRRFRNAEPKAQQWLISMIRALGKAVVLVVLVLQMTPKPADAATLHNAFSQQFEGLIHIVQQWIRRAAAAVRNLTFAARLRTAG